MRVLLLLSLTAQQPAQTPAKRTVEFTGTVLMNAFYNTALTSNSDVPVFAVVDTLAGSPTSGGSATVRQTRLGVLVSDPDVLGGNFTGEIDVDFFGGQPPTFGNRTMPVLRMRRALATVEWTHMQLMIGQETPLVSDRNPRSLAGIGIPDFSLAGNLWFWIPQVRVTAQYGSTYRLAFQGALLAPTAGALQPGYNTQADSGERTGRPYVQGRVRLGWGPTDDPSEIAVGGHVGWVKGLDSLSGDSILPSRAITFDARIKLGPAELIGEFASGKAIAGLGGGGIGQNTGVAGRPVRTVGGWGQLNVTARPGWMVGAGCGLEDPKDADVPANGRFRNLVCEGHVQWRPPGPLIFGFEYRHFKTRYAFGEAAANHFNLAAGFRL